MPVRLKGCVFVLLFFLSAQIILAMRIKAPTADEFAHHVASGFSYIVTGDFRMNPASPPLPRMLAALPLWFLKAKAPLDHPSWTEGNSPEFAKQFFYVYNHEADPFIFWARLPIVFLSIIFGLSVFLWSRHFFGDVGGVASLALYSFCPDILTHSGLATADLAVALFFFLALWAYWRYLIKPGRQGILVTGIFTGLALLSKFSAILLFPIFLIIAVIAGQARAVSFKKTSLFLLVCLFTVWMGYFFELKPLLKNTPDPLKKEAVYQKIGGEPLVQFAKKVPVPLATFSSAIVSMAVTRANGTNAFLMGQWSRTGWWYYYFVAFFIKNTLPFVLLAILSFMFIRKLRLDRTSLTILCIPIIFFFIVTLTDKAQAGIRYFLPIYPLLFVLCGGFVAYLWRKNRLLKGLATTLLIWHALEAALIFPHYLAYFNEVIGGPKNGYKYLRDSNLDWGQDLKGLASVAQKNKYDKIALYYPWPASPDYYKIAYRPLTETEFVKPQKTVYALSAHFMDRVAWAKKVEPDLQIGYSLFIYDMRKSHALDNHS